MTGGVSDSRSCRHVAILSRSRSKNKGRSGRLVRSRGCPLSGVVNTTIVVCVSRCGPRGALKATS